MPRLSKLDISNLSLKQMKFLNSLTGGKRGTNRAMEDFTYTDGSLKSPTTQDLKTAWLKLGSFDSIRSTIDNSDLLEKLRAVQPNIKGDFILG